MKEIEKKFYIDLRKLDFNLNNYRSIYITQNYLIVGNIEIRIRKYESVYNKKYYITYKKGEPPVREEHALEIDRESYQKLESMIHKKPLGKTRYYIPYNNKMVEVDIFRDDYLRPVGEVEFNSESEMNRFTFPNWLAEECNYTNSDFWWIVNVGENCSDEYKNLFKEKE